jgi:hypothetical protein
MDRQKIRELLKQTHPKHKIVEQEVYPRDAADSNAADVDVSQLSVKTWKKFGAVPNEKAPSQEKPAAADSTRRADLRERFRPRKLTGAGARRADADATESPGHKAGKLTLERLVPEDAGADADQSLDVLVDEEHGVIGESDSGPEEK